MNGAIKKQAIMRNTIKCIVTGAERITNNSYLGKKAEKVGVSVEAFREHYVSKAALGNMKADIDASSVDEVALKLEMSAAKLKNILILNGKVKADRFKELVVEPAETVEQPEQS